MSEYIIMTDSGSDLGQDMLNEYGIPCNYLSVRFTDDTCDRPGNEVPIKEFYDKVRNGGIAKTAATNVEMIKESFIPHLEAGKDILYLGFSSGLSTSVNSGSIAASELSETYPDRQIVVIDTLCASAGQGLVVYYAVKKQQSGASLTEVADYVRDMLPHLCHQFTVEDLVYLKRGGRISPAAAVAGAVLGIKPILHVDDEGHLIKLSTVRGRKASIKALADKYLANATPKDTEYFISHGDCIEDAKALEAMIVAGGGPKCTYFTYVSPVIGAHSGPGTLALFYLGTNR